MDFSGNFLDDDDTAFDEGLDALLARQNPQTFDFADLYLAPQPTKFQYDLQFPYTYPFGLPPVSTSQFGPLPAPDPVLGSQLTPCTFPPQEQPTVAAPSLPPRPVTTIPPAPARRYPNIYFHYERSKTRAETQIKCAMAFECLDPKFKQIQFPAKTIAKPKYLLSEQEQLQAQEESGETLFMDLCLVLASAVQKDEDREAALERARTNTMRKRSPDKPLSDLDKNDPCHPQNGGEVVICAGCDQREEKRAARRKKPGLESEWRKYRWERVVMINQKQIKKLEDLDHQRPTLFQLPQVMGPTKEVDFDFRIACYCRHQEEKTSNGYCIIFTFRDDQGNVVKQFLTPPFSITDDHKNKDSIPENVMGWVAQGTMYVGGQIQMAHSQAQPPLEDYSSINGMPMANWTPGTPAMISPMTPMSYSQPTTPMVQTFRQLPQSPTQPQYSTALPSATPPFPSFGRTFPLVQRTQSLVDNTSVGEPFGPAYRMDGRGIPRVVSLDTGAFQQMKQSNYLADISSPPQSQSSTPISQSRPPSPTWENGGPTKKPCFYVGPPEGH